MFGLLLTAAATFSEEAGTSIGKQQTMLGRQSPLSITVFSAFFSILFLLILAFLVPSGFFAPGFPQGFVFSAASLPTLLTRVVLELLQAWGTVYAIVLADRSTFGFLRVITLPLLLLVDVMLYGPIGMGRVAGIALIVASLILLFINHGLSRRGAWLTVFTAINAVVTISLYKYDISHFNSVEAEQLIILSADFLFFLFLAWRYARENTLKLLLRPVFFTESLLTGVGVTIISFAFLFAPASVIATAKRAFSLLFAVLFGHAYFREKQLLLKISAFALITVGLVLMV